MITVRIKWDGAYKVSSALNEHSYKSSYIICPDSPYESLLSLKSVDFIIWKFEANNANTSNRTLV